MALAKLVAQITNQRNKQAEEERECLQAIVAAPEWHHIIIEHVVSIIQEQPVNAVGSEFDLNNPYSDIWNAYDPVSEQWN